MCKFITVDTLQTTVHWYVLKLVIVTLFDLSLYFVKKLQNTTAIIIHRAQLIYLVTSVSTVFTGCLFTTDCNIWSLLLFSIHSQISALSTCLISHVYPPARSLHNSANMRFQCSKSKVKVYIHLLIRVHLSGIYCLSSWDRCNETMVIFRRAPSFSSASKTLRFVSWLFKL